MANGDPVEDAHQAWIYAANCLMYEKDPGQEPVNLGTPSEPMMVPPQEYWQIIYAGHLLVDLEADLERLQPAREIVLQKAAQLTTTNPGLAREYTRAADLCERAEQIVIETGAASWDTRRRRLLATAEHDGTLATLGGIPVIAGLAREELEEKLAAMATDPDPLDGVPEFRAYPGPTYDASTGRFELGRGRGGACAYWTLNTPGLGLEHGLIAGPRGVGKSSSLRLVLVEAIQSDAFVLWTADPSGRGQQMGLVEGVVEKSADTVEATAELLREALDVIRYRTTTGGYTDPTPDRPGVLIAVEECDQLFSGNAEATAIAEQIVATGGPAGVGLVVTAPGIDLAYFGRSAVLRAGLATTNVAPMGPDALRMAEELHDAQRRPGTK